MLRDKMLVMELFRWIWGIAVAVACLVSVPSQCTLAGSITVGTALDWRVLDQAELENRYAAAMIVTDWDKDGADEVLVPRWGGPSFNDQELMNRRSDLLELDGTVKPTGVLGEELGYSSFAWDYTGDGIPEIACDSRQRGGLAYDQWYLDKEARLNRQLEQKLAPLRQRQQAIKMELERLRQQGGSAERMGELAAEDDAIYQQIDDLRFSDEFSMSVEERKQASGFFVRNDTSIFNLAGQEIAKLPGRNRRGSQQLLGHYNNSSALQLMLGPAYFSREVEPLPNGGEHKVFSPNGKQTASWLIPAGLNYLAAGDVDGDGCDEIVGRHLGYAPHAAPLAELAMFDPGQPNKLEVLLRLPGDTPGMEPVACLDWDGDGQAEVILANGTVYHPASQRTWQLDLPPLVDPDFLYNAIAPSVALCNLDGAGRPELWTAVSHRQLACYTFEGSLVHYEDMGEPILQLAAAHDANGQEYLIVQLRSRILVWRVEPQSAPGSVLI